ALLLLVGLPTLAGGLYAHLGSPHQPAAPFADRAEERAQMAARQHEMQQLEAITARLETQLANDPGNLEASLRLGRAYALAGRFERAAETYRQAIERHAAIAELHSALGEALVMASDGIVGEEARTAFERALELDASDVRARFYRGLALLQRGEQQDALDVWVGLIEGAPADAPWLPDLRQRAAALAGELGLDPEQVLPPEKPVGTAQAEDGAGAP